MKLNDFNTTTEAKAEGFTIIVEDERYAGSEPDIFKTVEEMETAYTELYGDADCNYKTL